QAVGRDQLNGELSGQNHDELHHFPGHDPLPLPGSPQRVIPVPAAPWEYLLNDAPHWRRCH
ncbi:hypothetical protein, partial [Pseudomonas putida]|uniref:hypothetical protein n=1 Tax=Pseudomonas putida TaxID=303 RepID=UPI001F3D4B0C